MTADALPPPPAEDAREPSTPLDLSPWKYSSGPVPDYESPLGPVFDSGVTYTLGLLAASVAAKGYSLDGATETHDGDVLAAISSILYHADPAWLREYLAENEHPDFVAAPIPAPDVADTALRDVAAERERQRTVEGWTPAHDDKHTDGSLALAAALYAAPVNLYAREDSASANGLPSIAFEDPWPWVNYEEGLRGGSHPVPAWDGRAKHSRRRKLVIAAALILAEVERLDRAALARQEDARHG